MYAYTGNSPTNWSDPFGYGPGDKWYGFNNRDFQDWVHKQNGFDGQKSQNPDFTKDEMKDMYDEWKSLNRPQRDAKGNRRMAGRGACDEPQGEPEPETEPETEPDTDPNLLQQALNYASAHPGQVALAGAGVVAGIGVAVMCPECLVFLPELLPEFVPELAPAFF